MRAYAYISTALKPGLVKRVHSTRRFNLLQSWKYSFQENFLFRGRRLQLHIRKIGVCFSVRVVRGTTSEYLESASLPGRCRRTAYRPVHANARSPRCAAPSPVHFAIFHFHRERSLIPAVDLARPARCRNAGKFLRPFSAMTSSGKGRSQLIEAKL